MRKSCFSGSKTDKQDCLDHLYLFFHSCGVRSSIYLRSLQIASLQIIHCPQFVAVDSFAALVLQAELK